MKWIVLIVLCLSVANSFSQDEPDQKGGGNTLFKGKTYLKNALDLRDPFKRKINKKKSTLSGRAHEIGIYSNQVDSIESRPVENIRVIGVMIGKERRAMAKIAVNNVVGKEVYFLKEGMKIGPNAAEVKAILPGGVVFVEKIRNVYDQDEYLETVVPISSEE